MQPQRWLRGSSSKTPYAKILYILYANAMNSEIQHLINQLNEADSARRIAACDALGQFAASHSDTHGLLEHGIPAIVSLLCSDPIREVRWAAAYALGALGDASAIPALEAAYHRAADDAGLRLVIVKALGKTEHQDAAARLAAILHESQSRCLTAAAAKALQRINAAQVAQA